MPATPDAREPLLRYLEAQQISDSEMRVLLRDSARESARIAAAAGSGIGGDMRRAQLDIAQAQQAMWEKVGYQAQINIGDGVDAAAKSAAFGMETMLDSMGVGTVGMNQAMLMQGRQGIESLISKRENSISLSQQVYKTSVASGEQLDRTINAMIINGSSAREIASRVKGFIDPNTPGGASFAAMRLGRTELNNAFHATSIRLNKDNPFVEAMKWNLSGSHPRPDACNQYAEDVHMRNGEEGVYAIGDVPGKPHPQCLCFITPEVVSDDDFVKNFKAGQYDDYLDNQLGIARAGGPSVPIPGSDVTHTIARDMFKQVRKEMPGLQDSAYRREAARRLDMDYKEYTSVWKNPAKVKIEPTPTPPPVNPLIRPPVITMPKPPPPPVVPAIPAKLTHAEARVTFRRIKKENPDWGDAAVRRAAAEYWDMPYKEYLNVWKKPVDNQFDVPSIVNPPLPKTQWDVKPLKPREIGGNKVENVAGDLVGINPYRSTGEAYWRNNCTSTTSSFEMSRRGYDVAANAAINGTGRPLTEVYRAWHVKNGDQIGVNTRPATAQWGDMEVKYPKSIRRTEIEAHVMDVPEGGRGFITVEWLDSPTSHIYNWEIIDGRIKYFDAQTGKSLGNGLETLKRAKPDVWMARVDHLPTPSKEDLKIFVSNRGDAIAREKARTAGRIDARAESERNRLAREKYQNEAAARRQAFAKRQEAQREKEIAIQARQKAAASAKATADARLVNVIDSQAFRDGLSQAEQARVFLKRKSKGWSQEYVDAVTRYTQGSVVDMNMIKRDPARFFNSIPKLGPHPSVAARMNYAGTERLVKDVERLEEIISKTTLDRDVTVVRGVTTDMSMMRAGELFADPAFLSTTTDLKIAEDFATGKGDRVRGGRKNTGWKFVMRAKRGTNAVAGMSEQSEIIFGPGLKQRILSVDHDKRIIYSEVI